MLRARLHKKWLPQRRAEELCDNLEALLSGRGAIRLRSHYRHTRRWQIFWRWRAQNSLALAGRLLVHCDGIKC